MKFQGPDYEVILTLHPICGHTQVLADEAVGLLRSVLQFSYITVIGCRWVFGWECQRLNPLEPSLRVRTSDSSA